VKPTSAERCYAKAIANANDLTEAMRAVTALAENLRTSSVHQRGIARELASRGSECLGMVAKLGANMAAVELMLPNSGGTAPGSSPSAVIARSLELAVTLASELDGSHQKLKEFRRLTTHPDEQWARNVSRKLGQNLQRALKLAELVVGNLRYLSSAVFALGNSAQAATPPTSSSARGIVGVAVWMLPARHQARYREEFQIELIDTPRRSQLGYAVRQLGLAWSLRRSLVGAPPGRVRSVK